MVSIASLWLPILVSAVIVFFVSFIVHTFLPYHRSDYGKAANEDALLDAMRPHTPPPGDYTLPRPASMKDMQAPAFVEKLNRGPRVIMTVMPNGVPGIGPQLAQYFVYCAVVNGFAGCVTGQFLAPGADYRDVFHSVALVAFAGYSLALWQSSIWYKRKWSTTLKLTFDGALYALLTAGTFGWLWPA